MLKRYSGTGVEWVRLVQVAGCCNELTELLHARNFVTGLEASILNKNMFQERLFNYLHG